MESWLGSVLNLIWFLLFRSAFVLTSAVLCVALYYKIFNPFDYWKNLGIPQVKLQYPIIGNSLRSIRTGTYKLFQQYYHEMPNDKIIGIYAVHTPILFVKDPELIDTVLIKDFASISGKPPFQNPNSPLAKHLLNLQGDHWKSMRSKLTPTFSSGKLKGMHSQLESCSHALMKYMSHFEDEQPFEVRDLVSRFTMDVIATCAFGLNIDTINNPDTEFTKMGISVFKTTPFVKFLATLSYIFPKILGLYNRIFGTNAKYQPFFTNIIDSTLDFRKKNHVTRPDFLHLINELREKDLENLEDPYRFDHSSMVSNAFVFFAAGFETTAATVSYTIHEMAMNEDVQEKLYNEISTVLKKHDGAPTYEAIQEMTYLEQVLSETLRKYPPIPTARRFTTLPYRLPDSEVSVPRGTPIVIPIYALHHDPQYHPDPYKYRPERFSPDTNEIPKGTYLPFGGGPRNCIGARFAKQEAKVLLSLLLTKFKIVKCNKTVDPLKFDDNTFTLTPVGGIWVSVQKRK